MDERLPTRAVYLWVMLAGLIYMLAAPAFAGQAPREKAETNRVNADFVIKTVKEDFGVRTTLKNVRHNQLFIKFPTRDVGKEDLHQRVSNLKITNPSGTPLPFQEIGDGAYSIDVSGQSEVVVQYTFSPRFPGWDHHFSVVTDSFLHIPVGNFLFTVHADETLGNVLYNSVKFYLPDLPDDWTILTTDPMNPDGSIEVQGDDSMIHAGRYIVHDIKLQDTTFTVAVNDRLEIDHDYYLRKFADIIRYQYDIFGEYRNKKALLVVNPAPNFADSLNFGGQVKEENVIIYIRGLNRNTAQDEVNDFLAHFAHETFHLWLPASFRLKESMYWLTEGGTRYQQYKTLHKLGLLTEEQFLHKLAAEYIACRGAQGRTRIPLTKSGSAAFFSRDYTLLNYSKGAIVMYLLDEQLRGLGSEKSFEGLMGRLYRSYGQPGVKMGNEEVIEAVNAYLGNSNFAETWVLTASVIGTDDIPQLRPYLLQARIQKALDFLSRAPLPVKIAFPVVILLGLWLIGVTVKKRRGRA